MRNLSALAVLLCVLCSIKGESAESQFALLSGGEVGFTFYHSNLQHAGLLITGTHALDSHTDAVSLAISSHSSLSLNASEGIFEALDDGELSLVAGFNVMVGELQLLSENSKLVPKKGTRDMLWLEDATGKRWFYLDYGHFEQQGQTLHGRYMDVRVAAELADMLGKPALKGYLIGAANLQAIIKHPSTPSGPQLPAQPQPQPQPQLQLQPQPQPQPPAQPQGITQFCPVMSPNWPTQEGFDADIAMLKIDEVSEVARLAGRAGWQLRLFT